MEIRRFGLQVFAKGPADYFTGTVRIDPLAEATALVRALGASVTFEPGFERDGIPIRFARSSS
jgi:hypothetical protein